jgi:3-phenylpropionate/trans-cinnamate dioxygenase ferredoxin subunit
VSGTDVCALDELPPGARRVVSVDGRSIGVFNVAGALYAIRNACPHQGADLCRGTVGGTMLPSDVYEYRYGLDGRIVRCPWHGWEFDLATGEKVFDPSSRARVRTYPVAVVDGRIVIDA